MTPKEWLEGTRCWGSGHQAITLAFQHIDGITRHPQSFGLFPNPCTADTQMTGQCFPALILVVEQFQQLGHVNQITPWRLTLTRDKGNGQTGTVVPAFSWQLSLDSTGQICELKVPLEQSLCSEKAENLVQYPYQGGGWCKALGFSRTGGLR